jgi:predicted small lipoprotein YifL
MKMKTKRFILSLIMACLLLSVVACGLKEPIIKTPAGEMNLSVADLGPNWSLNWEQDLNELLEVVEIPRHVLDVNRRSFGCRFMEPFGAAASIISWTISTKSVASARKEMKEGDLVKWAITIFERAFGENEEMEPPSIGDEAVMSGGTLGGTDRYVLVFRKANVIGIVQVVGSEEVVTEESAMDYARKLEAKIR